MLYIMPEEEQSEITHIVCPQCKEKLSRVGLKKNSKVHGFTFKCRKCGKLWSVKTE